MSMQFNDIIMYTDLCENKSIHNMLRLVFYNCMICDTVQKYMVYNNAENKRWVKVAIPTLVQRQNTTLLQRWIMTSKNFHFQPISNVYPRSVSDVVSTSIQRLLFAGDGRSKRLIYRAGIEVNGRI